MNNNIYIEDDLNLYSKSSIMKELKELENILPTSLTIHFSRMEYIENSIEKLENISESSDFLFVGVNSQEIQIGPLYKHNKNLGCLKCFYTRYLNIQYSKESHNGLNEIASQRLEINQNIINRSLFTIIIKLIKEFVRSSYKDDITNCNYYVFNLKTKFSYVHNYIVDPFCSVCSKPRPDNAKDSIIELKEIYKDHKWSYRRSNTKLTGMKSKLVDHRSGLFHHIYRDEISSIVPFTVTEQPIEGEKAIELGIGRKLTFPDSEKVALLEGLERYVSMRPRRKQTSYYDAYINLKKIAVDPRDFSLHENYQEREPGYNLKKFNENQFYSWVWSYAWKSKKPLLVPEQFAYYRLKKSLNRPSERFCYETSNGCAIGNGLEESIFYSLMELIERDAFMATWYLQLPVKKIVMNQIDNVEIKQMIDSIESQGYKLHFFDISIDIPIPTIWVLFEDPNDDTNLKTYTAAASNPNPEKALLNALIEVVTSVEIYQREINDVDDKGASMYHNSRLVQSMDDHILLHAYYKSVERFEFVLDSDIKEVCVKDYLDSYYKQAYSNDFTNELINLLDKVATIGNEVYIVDQTAPAMEEFDLKATKVLVPNMLTMSFGQQYQRKNYERLIDVSRYIFGENVVEERLNLNPHPFP